MVELLLMATIDGQAVAIRSDQVESVVDIGTVTPVPLARRAVRGLAALRSRVVTVIDTGVALDEAITPPPRRRAVVTRVDGHHYALLVDALDDVLEFEVQPLTPGLVLCPRWAAVADGMIERGDTPVLIVDLPAIVARVTGEGRIAA
ncbi:chemotaxis protein CheW [Sphingomonas sp. Leaf407]|nr:chemotaxis protein CheW [Sphingomonas sp. Leaf25]KQN37837.1 chemotaxis protein CheW [Sphingomonas sp. Leaf42]KQT28205.1 chemotaxis protein CheW [Sphingomonas sp. Leaf407]